MLLTYLRFIKFNALNYDKEGNLGGGKEKK